MTEGASTTSQTATNLKLLRSLSISEIVYQTMHQQILSGQISPGQHVNENRLATELDVSRSAVREACRKLEKDGLVEITKNKGPFVRDLEPLEALELYDMRAVLEALSAGLAAQNRKESDLQKLMSCIEEMDAALASDQPEDEYRAAVDFHKTIAAISGNKSLADAISGISGKLSLFRHKFLNIGLSEPDNSDEKNIYLAIKEQDSERASELMKTHILRGKDKVMRVTQPHQ